jgi:SAM-dependent methyltransferase
MDQLDAARAMWAAGDYAAWGDLFADVGQQVVDRVGVNDLDVLDVATGTGTTAIRAARAGGRVTGLDLTPELLTVATNRAVAAGLQIRWISSDMTAMPLPDESYDRVLSTFGAMLAADRPAMAAELVRLCRPGGLVATTGWCRDAAFSKLGMVIAAFFPEEDDATEGTGDDESGDSAAAQAPPDPTDWGVPELATSFFAGLPVAVTTIRRSVTVTWSSADDAATMIATTCGPLTGAVNALREMGQWPKAREAIIEMLEAEATSRTAPLAIEVPYLLTVAERTA